MKNFPRMEIKAVTTDGNIDLIVTDSDDIYQSSGLQIQRYLSYDKNIFVPEREYGHIAINHEDTNYISAESALYILKSGEIGTSPILQKLSVDGKITFAYATKDEVYIATSGQTNILQKISVKA